MIPRPTLYRLPPKPPLSVRCLVQFLGPYLVISCSGWAYAVG